MAIENEDTNQPEQLTDPQSSQPPYSRQEVLEEIERQESAQNHWTKNLLVLGISLLIFFQLGLFKSGLSSVVIIVLVLLFHEVGHAIGMRVFGYKNVRMFFIPFFGAAVSGRSQDVPAYKKALVCLLGPMPGIIVGIGLAILYLFTRVPFHMELTVMLLIINTFNMLPFFPLDGGRFFEEILFSRNRWIELVFKILAALALIGLGAMMGAWVLALFGLISLLTVGGPLKAARVADELRPLVATADSGPGESANPFRLESISQDGGEEAADAPAGPTVIPPEIADQMIRKITASFGSKLNVKSVAMYARGIWERMHQRQPGVPATVGLVVVYFVCFLLAGVGLIAAAGISIHGRIETKIVEYQTPEGETRQKEQLYLSGRLITETQFDPNESLYHGRHISYDSRGRTRVEGTWRHGKQHGEWKTYDDGGNATAVTVFNNGRFVVLRELKDGQWTEKSLDDLPQDVRKYYVEHANDPPLGPMQLQKAAPADLTDPNLPLVR